MPATGDEGEDDIDIDGLNEVFKNCCDVVLDAADDIDDAMTVVAEDDTVFGEDVNTEDAGATVLTLDDPSTKPWAATFTDVGTDLSGETGCFNLMVFDMAA